MADYTYRNIKVQGAPDLQTAIAMAVTEHWTSRLDLETPPTQEEIDAAIAEEQDNHTEEQALTNFVKTAKDEVTWITDTLAVIDSATAAQVRDVVKRLLQENRALIRALVIREIRRQE